MWYTSFIVLTITLIFYHVRTNGQSSSAPPPSNPPSPAAEKCKDVPALKTSDPNPAYDIRDWVVARVTRLKDPAASGLDPATNVCSVFTYIDKCGAMHYTEKSDEKEPKKIFHTSTYAYYETTDSLVHYNEAFTKESDELNIFSIKFESMEDIPTDPTKKKEINPIPDPVLKAHQTTVASVAADKEGKWVLHRCCESATTFVSFPKEDILREDDPKAYVETFKQAIDEHLSKMNIDPATVEVIEMKLKFDPPAQSDEAELATSSPPPVVSSPPPSVPPPPTTSPPPSPHPPPSPPASSPPP